MIFLVILLIALPIVINAIVAKKFEQVAIWKGYPDVHAFAMCFFLGIIGCLYVIALPNITYDRVSLNQNKTIIKILKDATKENEEQTPSKNKTIINFLRAGQKEKEDKEKTEGSESATDSSSTESAAQ